LGTRIDNEAQARTDADTALGTRIDAETQARTDADTALGTRIDGEVQARTDGDATLQGQIDALVAIGAEPNVIDSISVNGVAQTVTDKNVDIDASSVVDGNAIAPSSVAATGNVSGSSVSDSVGSLAELRDAVSLKNSVSPLASLDDLPLNGFGLVENIASGIRPDTGVGSALYLSFAEGESRAVMFLRYGNTEAWLNTRNNNGWHGWKSLV
jgi:hypothetical protein